MDAQPTHCVEVVTKRSCGSLVLGPSHVLVPRCVSKRTWGEWAIATHGRYESYILLILFTHICYIHSMTFFVFSTIYFESKTLQNTISYQITLSNNSIRLEHILLTPTSSLYTSSTFYLTLSLSAHLFHTVFQ